MHHVYKIFSCMTRIYVNVYLAGVAWIRMLVCKNVYLEGVAWIRMLEAQEAREQSYVKEIEFLTSKPLVCTVNTDSGQHVASVKDKQVRCQYQKLQAGLIISRTKGEV